MTDENEISTEPTDEDPTPDELDLETYDLDGDGKISVIEEAERARLGLVDARLEEIAEEGGVKGSAGRGSPQGRRQARQRRGLSRRLSSPGLFGWAYTDSNRGPRRCERRTLTN